MPELEPQDLDLEPIPQPTILMVEDNQRDQDRFSTLLEDNYHVITTPNGIEALRLMEGGFVPDLILTNKISFINQCRHHSDKAINTLPIILFLDTFVPMSEKPNPDSHQFILGSKLNFTATVRQIENLLSQNN